MDLILTIYFAFNIFLSGNYIGYELKKNGYYTTTIKLNSFIILFLGVLIILIYKILELYYLLQIEFFICYYFTDKFNNLEIKDLKIFNERAARKQFSIGDKIYKHCVKLLNKRNNFNPKQTYCQPCKHPYYVQCKDCPEQQDKSSEN